MSVAQNVEWVTEWDDCMTREFTSYFVADGSVLMPKSSVTGQKWLKNKQV